MPEKKRIMNDMVVNKKPVAKKQVLSVPEKKKEVREVASHAPERIIPKSQPAPEPDYDTYNDYRDDRPQKNRSGFFLWMIAGVCMLALVLGIGGLFTHAQVILVPRQATGAVDTTLSLTQTHDNQGIFFGTATKTFTNEKVVPSIARADGEAKATGTVKFYNTTTSSKSIPAKTEIISSKGKSYLTSKSVTIPAKKGENLGQIDAVVVAVDSGIESNNGADDYTFSKPTKALEGVTIRSVTDISGGTSSSDAVADPNVLALAIEHLKKEFSNSKVLIDRLSEQVPDTMIALPITLPENPVTVAVDPRHEDGVHISASQTVTILIVSRTDVAQALATSMGVLKDTSVTIKDFGDMSALTNGVVAGQPIPEKLQVRATGPVSIVGKLDNEQIKNEILGLSRNEVRDYFAERKEVESYKLRMRPFWRRVLPVNPQQVEVKES